MALTNHTWYEWSMQQRVDQSLKYCRPTLVSSHVVGVLFDILFSFVSTLEKMLEFETGQILVCKASIWDDRIVIEVCRALARQVCADPKQSAGVLFEPKLEYVSLSRYCSCSITNTRIAYHHHGCNLTSQELGGLESLAKVIADVLQTDLPNS